MTIHPAFQGHGTFCYMPDQIARYYKHYPRGFETGGMFGRLRGLFRPASPSPSVATGFTGALRYMGMSHAWVRLFGLEGVMPAAETKALIDSLVAGGISVAGWGYCHGRDWQKEMNLAIDQTRRFGITGFVADIEPGRLLGGTRSRWKETEFDQFIGGLGDHFGSSNLGVSTWPVLKIQNDPEYPSLRLMQIAADRVAMFAPQAYWMKYPTTVHYNATGFRPADYPRDDPAAFVRLVIDSWRATGFNQNLVVTGRAYWGEGAPAQSVMESKIKSFGQGFSDWSKIVGFNWWHAGGNNLGMSPAMIANVAEGNFGAKVYARPEDVAVT